MDFNFTVNENLLIYSALLGPKSRNFKAKVIKDRLYEKYPTPFRLKGDDMRVIFASESLEESFNDLKEQAVNLFEDFKKTDEYKGLLEKTMLYKDELSKMWSKKKDLVVTHLKDILRIEIPNKTATVFVVSPEIGGGMYLGDMKIMWGHSDDWENYSIVYLAHEYLHSFFPTTENAHAIIELATDNELRIRLNGDGQYFTENGQQVGHERLRSLEESLLPKWREYLNNKSMTIYDFIHKYEA
jgi:hypothetical protein